MPIRKPGALKAAAIHSWGEVIAMSVTEDGILCHAGLRFVPY